MIDKLQVNKVHFLISGTKVIKLSVKIYIMKA